MIHLWTPQNTWILSLMLAVPLLGRAADVKTSYVAYRFAPGEKWTVAGSGDLGATRLDGNKRLVVDFSKGAEWVALRPPDKALLGYTDKIRLRVGGGSKGYPVHLFLRTHFMTFRKAVGELSGSTLQEIVTDGPPGAGWSWFGGENDGKLHGPLRVGEIRIESGGRRDHFDLDLVDLTVDGHVAQEKRCVVVAHSGAAAAPPALSAEIRCLTDQPLTGNLSWSLHTWDGEAAGEGERRVIIPPGAQLLNVPVELGTQPHGRKFLEVEFRLTVAGQEVPPVQAYWLARQPPNQDDQLRPESPFGMGLYLGRYRGPEMEQAARVAREAGVKWSREDFTWARIEPERGRYEWSFYDNLLATARRHGISVYAIVGYWAPWAKAYTEEGIDEYVAFTRQLVRRYKTDIRQWEIWNEPNIFFWQGPREMYATLLKKSYAAIKEEDPTAQVLGLSTAGIDFNFIAQMLARETPFDILTIHPYRRVLDDHLFINELKIVSDLIRRPDGSRRPVWLTEMGWSTVTPHNALKQDFAPNSQRDQAKYIARTYLCSIVSGVEPRTFWYDFRNDGDEPLYFEYEMGIVRRDFTPKPAYYAYATLARVLYGMQLAGKVDAGPGVFAYRFHSQDRAREVYALWNPPGDTRAEVPVTGTRARLVNTIGEERELPVTGSTITVWLNGRTPSYLVMD